MPGTLPKAACRASAVFQSGAHGACSRTVQQKQEKQERRFPTGSLSERASAPSEAGWKPALPGQGADALVRAALNPTNKRRCAPGHDFPLSLAPLPPLSSLIQCEAARALRHLFRIMLSKQLILGGLALSVFAASLSLPAAPQSPRTISFNRDVQPILSDKCFHCHGPDENTRKAKLRLDVREDALAREAFVPGKPESSELIQRITTDDPDDVMPPPEAHKPLTPVEKETLRRWIAEGAVYEKHWAYVIPEKPAVPAGRNGIDYLVQKRLRAIGLSPSPAADRRTLARRLHFDLNGLPPTPEVVESFSRDRARDAYARLVEDLLFSPHYGERMAIPWLDVVRFADTIGYHSDNPRNIWPYRDYVIRSFNENKPFDRFSVEQLAGDLLPDAGQEQKVASAFNRLLLSTEEGGAQPKDYESRMLTDRVRAVGTVWLAQTIGCAQCHDHKFDPVTSRDFYALGAFFADIEEPIIGRREEGMLVPDRRQSAELTRLSAELDARVADYEAPRPESETAWERAALAVLAANEHWTNLIPESQTSDAGVKLSADEHGIITADKDPREGKATYRITVRADFHEVTAFRLEALAGEKLPGQGPGRGAEGNFILSEMTFEDGTSNQVRIASASATFAAAGQPAAAAIDGSDEGQNGWSVAGVTGVNHAIHFSPEQPVSSDVKALTFVLKQTSGGNRVLSRFRLGMTKRANLKAAPPTAAPPSDIAAILHTNPAARTDAQHQKLAAYQRAASPNLIEQRQRIAEARKARLDFEKNVPRCLVSVSAKQPRTVRILPRGNWLIETGEVVQPALPQALASDVSAPGDRPLNRLDLARWIVSRDNPLTARVFMNRLWKQFFGVGLSKVLDDFGMQGEPPVNPELLDWLACEFMDSGWNVKHMVRLIVNSDTYKQVSTASESLRTRDPDNRELARQTRWRLDAELVRDNALSMAGLLVPVLGGPSVKPYQPDGYWENLNFPPRVYEADEGESQYRRGLYVWWQRTFLHPSMIAFDAPSREECAAERTRSNIPQQALVLLNDPTYVEAARAFAARILAEGGKSDQKRIEWAWRTALSRHPTLEESKTVTDLLAKHLNEYQADLEAARAFLSVGLSKTVGELNPAQLAAWTSVARVILNLHETITRS